MPALKFGLAEVRLGELTLDPLSGYDLEPWRIYAPTSSSMLTSNPSIVERTLSFPNGLSPSKPRARSSTMNSTPQRCGKGERRLVRNCRLSPKGGFRPLLGDSLSAAIALPLGGAIPGTSHRDNSARPA